MKRKKRRVITSIDNLIEMCNIIHNNKYLYNKVTSFGWNDTVVVICPKHGDFPQTLLNHVDGTGCPICGHISSKAKRSHTKEEFIEKAIHIHDYEYDYSKIIYSNYENEIEIICKDHGVFFQTPSNHLLGSGCPDCLFKNQTFIKKFLVENKIIFKQEFKIPVIKKKRNVKVDFYLPDYNLFIEYNGNQHYQPAPRYTGGNIKKAEENFKDDQIRDQKVRDYCKLVNINLLEIDGRKFNGTKLLKYLNNELKEKLLQYRKK